MSGDRHPASPAPVGADVAAQVADAMFALSTPSRVQILLFLLDQPQGVSELVEGLGLEQSSISHQLRVLRDHALVRVQKEGRRRVYALYDEHVVALLREAIRHVDLRSGRLDSARAGGVAAWSQRGPRDGR